MKEGKTNTIGQHFIRVFIGNGGGKHVQLEGKKDDEGGEEGERLTRRSQTRRTSF